MTDAENPWSDTIIVAQIPEQGLHRAFEADAGQRDALAKLAGVRGIFSARASFDLTPIHDGRVHVAGTLSARVGQTCVVTLDPVDNAIEETIDLMFAPGSQIAELTASADDGEDDAEVPDPPEPIEGGVIDLGRLATDVLLLGIDPYPRKPGAVFEAAVVPPDPEDHPFAGLKALKGDDGRPVPKKPKRG
jgi:hypothetical protein